MAVNREKAFDIGIGLMFVAIGIYGLVAACVLIEKAFNAWDQTMDVVIEVVEKQ